MARNYYAELGVQPDASTETIKQAYRQLARQYHPDVNPSASAVGRFTTITEAYHTLADSRRRLAYNQTMLSERATPSRNVDAVRTLTHREVRAAIERTIAYAITAALAGLALEWALRWIVQSTDQTRTGYFILSGIGFLLGLFWGIDANFVIADFISSTVSQRLFRVLRFASWIGGLFFLSHHALSVISTLGDLRALGRLPIVWISAGLGFCIASYWTLRDH